MSTSQNPSGGPDSNPGNKQQGKSDPITKQLIDLIETGPYPLHHDDQGTSYCSIDLNGIQKIVKIFSTEFEQWISYEYYTLHSKIPNQTILKGFYNYLSVKAQRSGTKIRLYNRIAYENGNIIIDLADGLNTAVIINGAGRNTQVNPPVLFQRYQHQEALPKPISGGNLRDLLPLMALSTEQEKCLVLSWLVASLIPDIERNFLLIEGPPGSGKTTLAKMLKSLIDPMKGASLHLSKKDREVAQVIDHHAVPLFDNVEMISKPVSDLFCQTYSGGSYSTKALYTNDDDFVFNLTGNAIFTSVLLKNLQTDFLNRTIKIKLDAMDHVNRKSGSAIFNQFNQIKPQLFGALLDTLVKTIKIKKRIPVPHISRTVDFDHYCMAAAEVLGFGKDVFIKARQANERLKLKGMIAGIPLINALDNFLSNNGDQWSGYMSQLLQQLPQYAASGDYLPKGANVLSKEIRELRHKLEAAGIYVASRGYNDGNGMKYYINRIDTTSMTDDPAVEKDLMDSVIDELLPNNDNPEVKQTENQSATLKLVTEMTEEMKIDKSELTSAGKRAFGTIVNRKNKNDIFGGGVEYENGYPKPEVGRYEPD